MNRMRPVGVPEDPLAVAVNVTAAPSADGFADDTRASVEVRSFQPVAVTDWTSTGEMTGGALALPWKRAVIACEPAARLATVRVALPEAIAPLPRSVPVSYTHLTLPTNREV